MLIYGESGAGKTPLIATLPGNPIIIDTDHGLLSLQHAAVDYIECNSLDDMRAAFREVKTLPEYDWIVLDSLTALASWVLHDEEQALIDAAAEKRNGKAATNPREGVDLRQAYQATAKTIDGVLSALLACGRNVLVTAGLDKIQSPVTGVVSYGPMAPGKALASGIPGKFNLVMRAMRERYDDDSEYTYLQCRQVKNSIARDRSNTLDTYEMPIGGESFPSLATIVEKIRSK